MPLGTSRLQRLQGAYVERGGRSSTSAGRNAREELDESLLVAPEREPDEGGDDDFDPDEDPLLEKAIEVVVQTQTASVSLLQRRLRVGYTRGPADRHARAGAASSPAMRARSRAGCSGAPSDLDSAASG